MDKGGKPSSYYLSRTMRALAWLATSNLASLKITHCHCLHYCEGDGIMPARSNGSSRHDRSAMYPGVKTVVWWSDAIPQVSLDGDTKPNRYCKQQNIFPLCSHYFAKYHHIYSFIAWFPDICNFQISIVTSHGNSSWGLFFCSELFLLAEKLLLFAVIWTRSVDSPGIVPSSLKVTIRRSGLPRRRLFVLLPRCSKRKQRISLLCRYNMKYLIIIIITFSSQTVRSFALIFYTYVSWVNWMNMV
jgi:hypothetical protein